MSTTEKKDFSDELHEIHNNRVLVRSYPKTVYLWPTMLVGLLFWLFTEINSIFNLVSGGNSTDLNALFATVWIIIITFNLIVISFDFSASRTFTIFVTFLSIFLLYVFIRDYFHITLFQNLPSFKQFLIDTGLSVSPVFYLYFSIILLIIYGILAIKDRVVYWEFEPNRIIYHRGLFDNEESYPAQQSRVITETPDIFERLLFRAGTIFIVVNDNKIHKLENVYNAASKDDQIQKILSVINVESE